MSALVGAALALAEPSSPPSSPLPSTHTLLYYNARLALREGQALEAVKLWLLRNAYEERTGEVSAHDADFHSVTWAAMGELGVCPDGYPTDEAGAGLWPVALHNWVVRNMRYRTRPKRARAFDAFALGYQQRFFAIGDVLSARELEAVRLSRGLCLRPRTALVTAGEPVLAKLSDRQVAARLLQHLLERSHDTLVVGRVRGIAAIEARLFDISLQLTALAAQEARQDAREQARRGREIGMSRESIAPMREEAARYTFAPDSPPARILEASVRWPVSEWMSLSPERRLFLFDHARVYGGDPKALGETALGIVDRLVAAGEGAEVENWIARCTEADRAAVWGDPRGPGLLALDPASGFRERAVIALHRGVHHLEAGALPDALRSLAYALQHAPESRSAEAVQGLSLRWLSYVAAQFEISDELLIMLEELVPRREYAILLEDLMWRAAFRADRGSFERGVQGQPGRDALERRITLLYPLATGDVGRFVRQIREGLETTPSETLRFLDQLVLRLEREDVDVRTAQLPTLARLRQILSPLSVEAGNTDAHARQATALIERALAIQEGLGGLGVDASIRDRARILDPRGEVFAGSVRLAPADPLPWPFSPVEVPAPSIFTPLLLRPVEWTGGDGATVFGWSIGG